MRTAFLEIACFNVQSAIIGAENGADRIELCMDKSTEGITPTFQMIQEARGKIKIPLNIMLRPRAGSYIYNSEEFELLKTQVLEVKKMGVDGLVFGCLEEDGKVHVQQNTQLVELAHPLPCTFHRAFDEITDKQSALETLISCGYKTILTSAGKKTAWEAAGILHNLITQAKQRIIVMPGGGVRSSHAKELQVQTGALWLHSSAITQGGEIAVPEEVRALHTALI